MFAKALQRISNDKAQKNDRVAIHGIFVGHNYRTNRCIIQLVEPSKTEQLTNQNGELIEVDEKYIERHKPSKSKSISTPSKPRASIAQKLKDFTDRDITKEWKDIIGDNDIESIALDASETCDSWTLNDCDSCKRVLFCLQYYRLWIIHKTESNKDDFNKLNKDFNKNKFFSTYLIEFMRNLEAYGSTAMLNDFHHIKQFHIANNMQHNHSVNNEDKQDIFEFFKRKMGMCNYSNCRSYSRNNRDRGECSEAEQLRRELYFINESELKIKSDEITETNIQQLFDMIHCALLHPQSSTTGSGSSKFITEVKEETKEEKKEEKKDQNIIDEVQDEKKEEVQTAILSSYGFGAQFKYHESNHKMYIAAKWKNLKQEILNNKLYTISKFDYESIVSKSSQYLESYRGKSLIARKQSKLNDICHIKPNTPILISHIITLMLYTNMDDLQREFKKGCRYLAKDNMDVKKVKKRNSEIANWCRILWESIQFYGESISKKQVFYHGLSCKLLFDSVIAAFNCPTSTTVNKSVAFNFSSEKGIIVQLSKFASLDSHYLDVSDLSDYPNEQERLFFQAQLGFQDIIYQNTSNKYFIKCLSLFQNITKGNFFTHDSKIFKNKHQKTLIKMMDCCLTKESNKKIPDYMQQLFEHYCKSIKQFGNIIWINKEEFSKLKENIRNYLKEGESSTESKSEHGLFLKWLKSEYNIKIKYPLTVSYVVKNSSSDDKEEQFLNDFWEGKSVILPTLSHVVKCDQKKPYKVNFKFKLKKGATTNDGTAMIMCKIINKNLPNHVQKLKCDIGIFCPQINFSYTTAITVSTKLLGIPLCESIKLESLDAFEWKIFIKFRGRVDKKNKMWRY